MSDRPKTIEANASPDAIAAALEQVADGGRVIVTGAVSDIPAFDTYGDLHVRGLELVVQPAR